MATTIIFKSLGFGVCVLLWWVVLKAIKTGNWRVSRRFGYQLLLIGSVGTVYGFSSIIYNLIV